MNELIRVTQNDNDEQVISGRELHEFLEVKTRYNDWFERMTEYGFAENVDFVAVTQKRVTAQGNQTEYSDHALKLDMAKELSMIQRTEKGKQARQYFLEVEKAWNSEDMILLRSRQILERKVDKLQIELQEMEVENSKLAVENEIQRPKAEYFDDLVERNMLTNFRETAKLLQVKERKFIAFLIAKKYVFRDKKGKLMPFAQYVNDLFEIKESKNEKTSWAGTQTLITPRGRETFKLLAIH